MACVSCAPREVCLGASGSAFFCLFLRGAAPLVSETIQSGVSSSVPTMMRTMFCKKPVPCSVKMTLSFRRSTVMLSTSRTVDFFIRGLPQKLAKSCSPTRYSAACRILSTSGE